MPQLLDTLGQRNTPSPSRGVSSYSTSAYERQLNQQTQALDDTAKSLQRTSDNLYKRETRDALLDATARENQAKRDMLDLMYGANGQGGLMTTTGAGALGSQKQFAETFEKVKEKTFKDVKHPLAQEHLMRSMESLETQFYGKVLSHESGQRKAYAGEQMSSRIGLELESIAKGWNDPAQFKQSMDKIVETQRALGRLKGLSPEGQELARMEAVSSAHLTRFKAIFESDDSFSILKAKRDFELAKENGDVTADHASMLDKVFDQQAPIAEAKIGLSVFDNMDNAPEGMFDNEQKMKEATRGMSAKGRTEFYERLTARNKALKAAKEANTDAIVMDLHKTIARGGEPSALQMMELDDAQRKDVTDYWKMKNGIKAVSPKEELEREEYWDNLVEASARDPKNLLKFSVTELRLMLSDERYESAISMREKARKAQHGNDPDERATNAMLAATEADKTATVNYYVKNSSQVSKGSKEAFNQKLRLRINEFEKANNRPIRIGEIREIGDSLIEEVVLQRNWWPDKTVPLYKVTDDDIEDIVVPSDWRNKFLERLFAVDPDAVPSEEELRRAYLEQLGR